MNALRTSYSSRELFHTCERKYQLVKLVGPAPIKEENEYFCHGHAFGAGAAEYILSGDKQKALFACWMGYWPIIDTEEYNAYVSCAILEGAFPKLDEIRRDYTVAYFDSKPAIELSARVNVNESIYDVAFIDLVLINKATGRYGVFEVKTTSSRLNDLTPLYKNSSQTIGYSIILDAIAGSDQSDFDTIHFVAQMKSKKLDDMHYHIIPFKRNIHDRLNWFLTLGLDIQKLQTLQKMNYFPMRNSCLSFNRPCQYFGTCDLRKTDTPRVQPEDTNEYQFVFELDDIVIDHIKRVEAML